MKYVISSMADWSAITPNLQKDLYDNYNVNFRSTYRTVEQFHDDEPGGQLVLKIFSTDEVFDAPITIAYDEKEIIVSDCHRDFFINIK